MLETVTLKIPELFYKRFEYTAQATQRSLDEVILHALRVGSPPVWDDVPAEFQADLAAMDKLDDATLWQIAQSRKSPTEMIRYDELLERNQDGLLSSEEQLELNALRHDADRFMLRKAHAAALLRWRGHSTVTP